MPLSKDDFKYIEKELSSVFFGRIELLIEGYEVTYAMLPNSPFSNSIMTYVNGEFIFKWTEGDCHEARFLRSRTMLLLGNKFRKGLKGMSKKFLKENGIDLANKRTSYSPLWNSFRTLFAHLKKFEDIQLIREEENSNG
ncbi:MAG: hypothetical protein BA863_03555 [Desulfovibrio sp. S3730MH75]|nr:MAG: hypothetical protein BA863_03555 [Desulfovibrio sp. S3730MH75]